MPTKKARCLRDTGLWSSSPCQAELSQAQYAGGTIRLTLESDRGNGASRLAQLLTVVTRSKESHGTDSPKLCASLNVKSGQPQRRRCSRNGSQHSQTFRRRRRIAGTHPAQSWPANACLPSPFRPLRSLQLLFHRVARTFLSGTSRLIALGSVFILVIHRHSVI